MSFSHLFTAFKRHSVLLNRWSYRPKWEDPSLLTNRYMGTYSNRSYDTQIYLQTTIASFRFPLSHGHPTYFRPVRTTAMGCVQEEAGQPCSQSPSLKLPNTHPLGPSCLPFETSRRKECFTHSLHTSSPSSPSSSPPPTPST